MSKGIHKNNKYQRDFAKEKLKNKYNISEDQAELILKKIEYKKVINDKKMNCPTENQIFNNGDEHNIYETPYGNNLQIYQTSDDTSELKSDQSQKNGVTKEVKDLNTNSQNVDEVLSDIIPDYNKNISIELQNVELTFDIVDDKIDTLKETIIRTLNRNKSKKIKFKVLDNISFKIYKGEKVGIIGYNGAGKSTLLSVICGIYPQDKGIIKTYGNISPLLSLGSGFDNNFSGRRNIFLNGAVLGYEKDFLESKVDEIIEFSELGRFIDVPIKNYSSGMIAKLSFSIATAVEPDILIIDEILGVGDVNFQKKSRDKIKSLMGGGTTVLFVSHSIPQVRELCDKAIWIDNGKIREIGEVNNVCDHYIKDAEKASNEQLNNIQFR